MLRTSFALVTLLCSLALAQTSDEWNTFPPKPPAPASTTPDVPAKSPTPPAATPSPAPTPAPAPVKPVVSTTPAPKPAPAAVAAPKATATPDAGLAFSADGGSDIDPNDPSIRIISQKERFLAGTEPHSPSTWGNEWNSTENSRVTVGQLGLSTAYVPSARLGPKGLVRVGLMGEYLNITNFPVNSAQDIRSAITFGASYQPFTWGEVFVGYAASANTNNRTAPNLIQALGDLTLGIKASNQWATGFWAGLDLRLLTFSGVGNQGIDRFAVGFKPTAMATFDFRTLSKYALLVTTANLGFTIDSTAGLVTTQKLNASEEFALSVNHFHRFNFGLSVEIPLPVVTPFVEYGFALPLGASSLVGPDGLSVAATAAMAQQLGLGLKVTAIKDLTLMAGVNLGLARKVALGIPATPPWNFYFGASFAIDPSQRGETKFVETLRERKLDVIKASPLKLEGVITDSETKKPVSAAVLSVAGVKPSASNEAGEYQTLELPQTKVKLTVARDGYKPLERDVTLEADKPTKLDLALDPEIKKAKFQVSTTSAKKGVKATVIFKGGTEETKVETADNATVPVDTELLAGQYVITANADGYLSQTREVQVTPGATLPVNFELVAAPKKSLVIFKGDKIEILQQVHFATGKSQILADSFNLLQQVVDAVIKNNVKRIKVEGHTDNRGDKAANQALSEERARAVADYLIAQGIESARVEASGYGDSKPIAPNLTARGRELNRRVEFIILEK